LNVRAVARQNGRRSRLRRRSAAVP
jgi:hypothetical protein